MDIINMSIGHPPFNPATVVSQYISNKLAQSTDTIFFASTKQFDQIDNPAELLELFPANCANVIPVCCLTRDLTMKYWDNLPAPLIIVPYFLDSSCSIKTRHYYFQVYGSSVSTALVSGITSLLLSADNTITRTKQGVLNALKPYSSTVEEAFSNPGPEIHFIIKT